MEASHFDVQTAYAAVNCIRLDDMKPHIYKTNDGGKTWKEIVNGLPNDPINAVREDPFRKGMLYAGSERAVYVSLDEGEHWQTLRMNMPATSIRDLVIKDNDIVVGTHGRSFWILDDIAPLRELNTTIYNNPILLHRPSTAYRVRWGMYTDTPVPQEESAGENPPDGAIIDYYFKQPISGEVVLEILDAKGNLVRKFSSSDKPYTKPQDNVPDYWVRPQQTISTNAGGHRFIWDLHYTPIDVPPSYPIGAVYQNTAPNTTSPWAMPGVYTIKLNANEQSFTQPLTIKMDPRVKTTLIDLQIQFDLSKSLYDLRNTIRSTKTSNAEAMKERNVLENQLSSLMDVLQDADSKPTTQAIESVKQLSQKATIWLQKISK